MRKYVVIPGWVRSQSDGELHFIDAPTLMQLYKIDPKECATMHGDFRDHGKDFNGLIRLRPRRDGKYEIPT